jgi:uncharacterized protein YbjT (DUF2867 family)
MREATTSRHFEPEGVAPKVVEALPPQTHNTMRLVGAWFAHQIMRTARREESTIMDTRTNSSSAAHPILVTGAAGRVGAVGRGVTELLLKQGCAVRAMVRHEDERAQALRDMGAEVVAGDLLDLDAMHRAVAGCEVMYFGMSVSDDYLAATVNAAAVAKYYGLRAFINMSQMTLSQMSITQTTPSPQHKLHWLAEQALNWSGLPVVHVRPTVFLESFFLLLTSDSVSESDEIRLPLGEGKTSPVAVEDVARVIVTLLADPATHIGKTYHLTGPQSENLHFFAREYSKALGRTITYSDIPLEPWRDALLERGLPDHLVNHLATMAVLHREGRYDRKSDDVFALTGQAPIGVQEFVRKNAAAFAARAHAA